MPRQDDCGHRFRNAHLGPLPPSVPDDYWGVDHHELGLARTRVHIAVRHVALEGEAVASLEQEHILSQMEFQPATEEEAALLALMMVEVVAGRAARLEIDQGHHLLAVEGWREQIVS